MLDALVRTAIGAGARMARPGEFSERAYLNGKMDLTQAEAVADLINAESEASARAAVRSLQGDFSRTMNALSESLVRLRVQVEAAIDFPDEDIDLLAAPGVTGMLDNLLGQLNDTIAHTRSGVRLTEGARLVLIGAPNVGKSSVLNRLCGEDRAIVTTIAGTTRDVLREQLQLGGVPVELVDTAGLRDTDDVIEAEGVRRAQLAASQADLLLAVYDSSDPESRKFITHWLQEFQNERSFESGSPNNMPIVAIANKVDLIPDVAIADPIGKQVLTYTVSAKSGLGIPDLIERLVELLVGSADNSAAGPLEHVYSARSRHLMALAEAATSLAEARQAISAGVGAELVAEHLRHAQTELGSVCGEITTDALLGEIFSSFCIGK